MKIDCKEKVFAIGNNYTKIQLLAEFIWFYKIKILGCSLHILLQCDVLTNLVNIELLYQSDHVYIDTQ